MNQTTLSLVARDGSGVAHKYGPMGLLCRTQPGFLGELHDITLSAFLAGPHCARCASRMGVAADKGLFPLTTDH